MLLCLLSSGRRFLQFKAIYPSQLLKKKKVKKNLPWDAVGRQSGICVRQRHDCIFMIDNWPGTVFLAHPITVHRWHASLHTSLWSFSISSWMYDIWDWNPQFIKMSENIQYNIFVIWCVSGYRLYAETHVVSHAWSFTKLHPSLIVLMVRVNY